MRWLNVLLLCVAAVYGEQKKMRLPELGLEPLDPFTIGNLVLDKKKNIGSPVDIDLSWENAVITGIKSAVLTSAKADWDNNLISFEASLSEPVDIKGKYHMDGIVLILPIKGDGDFDCKLEGFKAHIKVHGQPQEIDGKKYMIVDRLVFTFDVKHMTVEYKNLFSGDRNLGDTMNSFLNENWRDIVDELKPAIEAALSSHFQPLAEKVFNSVPIDEIALP
ncbi:unnamed protein product [Nesidiocoris tenuis]|uniref:Lipid-binding serum glycoprotein N-terminal domain-containing protein n=1 Tax=Nesidiocoris tenuis TaxID=355587 RepID=A0A6H5G5K4_9HEMI|nr:unnamed protein product [Nesidiocoris tenuis]